jgi:hypothetical protein
MKYVLKPGTKVLVYLPPPVSDGSSLEVGKDRYIDYPLVEDPAVPFAGMVTFVHPGAGPSSGEVNVAFVGHGSENLARIELQFLHKIWAYRETAPEGAKRPYAVWGQAAADEW